MVDNTIYNIHYTNRALSDAIVIRNYLLYNFTQKGVSNFYKMLSVFEGIVAKFPELYAKSAKSKNVRRAVLSKQLAVFYTIRKDTIQIIAILDNRMDVAKWPK